jgi:hypothetical protein
MEGTVRHGGTDHPAAALLPLALPRGILPRQRCHAGLPAVPGIRASVGLQVYHTLEQHNMIAEGDVICARCAGTNKAATQARGGHGGRVCGGRRADPADDVRHHGVIAASVTRSNVSKQRFVQCSRPST